MIFRARKYPWIWVIPILLLSFWLVAHSLDTRPVWYDELRSIQDSGGDPYHPLRADNLWDSLALRNPVHAPLYFYALNVWATFTGWHPASLRLLSLIFGFLSIALTYRLTRALLSVSAALFSTAVLATSAFYVYYMIEMRVYSLMALLTIAAVWFYLRIIRARTAPSRWLWLGLLAAVTGTLYSHYLATFPLIALGLYHLLFVRKDRRWWQVTGVFALSGVLFLPWLSVFIAGFKHIDADQNLQAHALSAPNVVVTFAQLFSNGIIVLLVPLLALALLGLRRRSGRSILFVAVITLVTLVAANQIVHFIVAPRTRYLITLWPIFALTAALGVYQLRRWPIAAVAITVVWMVFGVRASLTRSFMVRASGASINYPVQVVAEMLQPHLQSDDEVILYMPDRIRTDISDYDEAARFYFQLFGAGDKIHLTGGDIDNVQTADERALLATLEPAQRVWVSYSEPSPETIGAFLSMLDADFHSCFTLTEQRSFTVALYVKKDAACPAALTSL